ncbi:MAG: lytic murein transglycosylase, partial [Endozoicomonadaceae bacterium]|nr:lytic murein transglycosylase [Endozoicomonadaceae bacterium]
VRGLKITVPATIEGKDYQKFISDSPVPEFTLDQVVAGGLKNTRKLNRSTKVRGLKLQGDQHDEYWLTTKNFYVITRYNRSDLYAMAVYTLGAAIQEKYHDSVTNNAYRPAASG